MDSSLTARVILGSPGGPIVWQSVPEVVRELTAWKKSARWGWWETLATEWPPPHHSPFPCHSRKHHISGFSVLHVSFWSSLFAFSSFPLPLYHLVFLFSLLHCFPPSLPPWFLLLLASSCCILALVRRNETLTAPCFILFGCQTEQIAFRRVGMLG